MEESKESHSNLDEDIDKQFNVAQTFGVRGDQPGDFEPIGFETGRCELGEYMHAAHLMIYAMDERKLWGRFNTPANIMMQSRFDGMIGFPGGLMDKGPHCESPVQALNRELEEEISLDTSKFAVTQNEHFISHVNHKKRLVLHFYVKCVSAEEYREIEKNTLNATEWGVETYGIIRVPLFTMDDNYRGLPVFLSNQFAGNAKDQLISSIRAKSILPEADLSRMLEAHKTFCQAVN